MIHTFAAPIPVYDLAPARRPRPSVRSRRGFSLVELMLALTISASLLTAALVAFDSCWRGYKEVSEAASTHVVARIVTHRILAMIRTGSQFGPYPADVLNNTLNPLTSTYIEFVTAADLAAGNNQVTRIERRNSATVPNSYELWYVLLNAGSGNILQQHPMLTNVQEASFVLQYQPGPRLVMATIDLTVLPLDDHDIQIGVGDTTPSIRLVASAMPRQFTE